MPRLMTTLMLAGCLVLIPACGGGEGDSSEADADRPDGVSDAAEPTGQPVADVQDKARQVVDEMLADLNEVLDTTSGVKDVSSATEALPKLKPYIDQFKKYAEQFQAVKPESKAGMDALEEQIEPQMRAVAERFKQEMQRLEGLSPLVNTAVKPVMEKIAEAVKNMGLPSL